MERKLTPAALTLLDEVVKGWTAQVDGRRVRPMWALQQAGLIRVQLVDHKFPPRYKVSATQAGIDTRKDTQ